jgi:hypothetical protein
LEELYTWRKKSYTHKQAKERRKKKTEEKVENIENYPQQKRTLLI